jgi:NAD(P)-dependent dehydrogenase (short-subunit alcohol dehydrogenase family)
MPPPERVAPFAKDTLHDIYHTISPNGALSNSANGLTMVNTGAGKGIDRTQALTSAKAGVKVVALAARRTREVAEVEESVGKAAPGAKLVKVSTDATHEESVKTLFESVEEGNGS